MTAYNDKLFMQRALDLARLGLGAVSPNPLVGCVIVKENQIISEGWHQHYGGPHAEVNAINNLKTQNDLSGCTVYVNLEPCPHHGKTPPCADLLSNLNPKRVVIGNVDTHPLVQGRGIDKLQQAGVPTETGLLEKEGRILNKRFFTGVEEKRPYIILKWASSSDGFIAGNDNNPSWITGSIARKWVHKWRTQEDGILVGTNTALEDNPQLNARSWEGKDPVRIVIDRNLRLPCHLHLFNDNKLTLCYNYFSDHKEGALEYIKLSGNEVLFFKEMLFDLYQRNIQSLIVEGGEKVLNAFIKHGYWDEARIFYAPVVLQNGIKEPTLQKGMAHKIFKTGEDHLMFYYNN